MRKLKTIKDFCKQNPNFMSESSIRWLIYNEKENGFDEVIRRVGRRIFIDEAQFEIWIDKINDKGAGAPEEVDNGKKTH